jgi:hypothetical protein
MYAAYVLTIPDGKDTQTGPGDVATAKDSVAGKVIVMVKPAPRERQTTLRANPRLKLTPDS